MSVEVFAFRDTDGRIALFDWFAALDGKTRAKLYSRIRHLAQNGHNARRPHVENLGGGSYELRARWQNVNYRII